MTTTSIEWADSVWNPVVGCTPVSAGCLNCYAATMARRHVGMGTSGYQDLQDAEHTGELLAQSEGSGRPIWDRIADAATHARTLRIVETRGGRAVFTGSVRCLEHRLGEPLHWRKPRRIFVCSMADLFHEAVPFDFIDRVFAVAALCPQHQFLMLTKRPERMAEYVTADRGPFKFEADHTTSRDWIDAAINELPNPPAEGEWPEWPLPNVWLGTSVEDQAAADERIPHLLRCPAAVRFLSVEPLLGPVDLLIPGECSAWSCPHCGSLRVDPEGGLGGDDVTTWACPDCNQVGAGGDANWTPLLHLVIVGGESGAKARPCDVHWIRSVVRQCADANVPCFVKQLGTMPFLGDGKHTHVSGHRGYGVVCDQGDPCPHCGVHPITHWLDLELNDRKGGDPAEWPEDLRVRQMPEVRHG